MMTKSDAKVLDGAGKAPLTCVDCHHYRAHGTGYLCSHPRVAKVDLVTGQLSTHARDVRASGLCGPEGKLWESIPPMPKFPTYFMVAGIVAWVLYITGGLQGAVELVRHLW
jgi:hypothetical protein